MVDGLMVPRVLVRIGGLTVYWYGVLYVVAFANAYIIFSRLQKYRQLFLVSAQRLELFTWGAVGVIVGGRMGYVLLYEPFYYWVHPLEVLYLSHGVMSSLGGIVGVAAMVWLWSRRTTKRWLGILDVLIVPAAFGMALGRLGNIINHELYTSPLAQLVALGFPVLIAGVSYWRLRVDLRSGSVVALFLILYSLTRFVEEFLRQPEWPHVFGWVTRGQLYTAPLFLVGVVLFVYLLKDESSKRNETGL